MGRQSKRRMEKWASHPLYSINHFRNVLREEKEFVEMLSMYKMDFTSCQLHQTLQGCFEGGERTY